METLITIIIIVLVILLYFFRENIFSLFEKEKEYLSELLKIPDDIFHQTQKKESLPCKKIDFLLNIPERKFYEYLEKIIPDNYVTFPQVLMSKIIKVDTSSKKEFWTYHNKINKKTLDFVIFEKKYLNPVLVIEYDGKTHETKKRQERDCFVNEALVSARLKIFHVKHENNIDFEELKRQILNLLNPSPSDF